jgi:hypothetical protein
MDGFAEFNGTRSLTAGIAGDKGGKEGRCGRNQSRGHAPSLALAPLSRSGQMRAPVSHMRGIRFARGGVNLVAG